MIDSQTKRADLSYCEWRGTEYEPLFDFKTPCEIDTTDSLRGWLRFFIRGFPLDAGTNGGLKKEVRIKLLAIDKKPDDIHVAYKGPIPDGECGPIEKIPQGKILYA